MRGFHAFMRAVPAILVGNPDYQILIVGGNNVSYGQGPEGHADWKSKLLADMPLDPVRVHFLGTVDYAS